MRNFIENFNSKTLAFYGTVKNLKSNCMADFSFRSSDYVGAVLKIQELDKMQELDIEVETKQLQDK